MSGHALFALKVAVTLGCFAYLATRIQVDRIGPILRDMDLSWIGLAVGLGLLQVPLVALRWRLLVNAIEGARFLRVGAALAITAIGVFFGQVLPNIAGDGIRAWLLGKLGMPWRRSLLTVLLDRGVAVYVLAVVSLLALALPASYALPRMVGALAVSLGVGLALGAAGLLMMPAIARPLARRSATRWVAEAGLAAHRALRSRAGAAVLALSAAVHAITIAAVYALGQAMAFPVSLADAAVLFAVMMTISLVPVAVGGWGLREVAIVSMLGQYGVAPETALAFSVGYGLVFLAASLPGALVYAWYAPERSGSRP